MSSLPPDFDATRARNSLRSHWSDCEPAALEQAFLAAAFPQYDQHGLRTSTRPAPSALSLSDVPKNLETDTLAGFDVAFDVLGRALPPDRGVALAREMIACRPWRGLRDLTYEAASRLDTEDSFRFLLSQPFAFHLLTASRFPGVEALAIERLLSSPVYAIRHPAPTRSELDGWSEEKRAGYMTESGRVYSTIDAAERNVVQELISLLVLRGSAEGRRIARAFFEEGYGVNELRVRSAVALFKLGERADLELLSQQLDDRDAIIRENAIKSVLALDIGSAWERLGGDKLSAKGNEAAADEVLFVVGRDLTGKSGPIQEWARTEPRFADLARRLLKNRKIRNADLVLKGLGEKV